MNRFTYTGSLLAVALGGYGAAAHGQDGCGQQVEQLQSQVQESELDTQTKRQIEDLLDSARDARPQRCQSIVMDVREQLDSARSQQTSQVAGAEDPSTHVVETETVAQTGPTEQTEATITTEESLERSALGESRADVPGAAAQAERPPQPSLTGAISDAQAAELVGKDVKSRDGEELGEITAVTRSLSDQQLHALVDVGGVLGIGERTVSIPLQTAQIDQDGNVMTQMSLDEMESMEEYDPTEYASIDEEGDRVLR
jgi:hypothetical protein